MKLLRTKLSDFKPITLKEDVEIDNSLYEELKTLLKRIGRSEQKASHVTELLKDEISESLSKHGELVDKIREESNQVNQQLKTLERGFLDYFDILDNLEIAVEQINDKEFLHSVKVALKVKKQINDRMGIQRIPGEGAQLDSEVHYVIDTVKTDREELDNTVQKVIESGYRRGNRLMRKATVVAYKYEEK